MNESGLLNEEEKQRFCFWLKIQIHSSNQMLGQFENEGFPQQLVQREKLKLAGYKIVLADIESGESFTVGGGG